VKETFSLECAVTENSMMWEFHIFLVSCVVTDKTFCTSPSKEMLVEIRLLLKLSQVSQRDALEPAFHCHIPYLD